MSADWKKIEEFISVPPRDRLKTLREEVNYQWYDVPAYSRSQAKRRLQLGISYKNLLKARFREGDRCDVEFCEGLVRFVLTQTGKRKLYGSNRALVHGKKYIRICAIEMSKIEQFLPDLGALTILQVKESEPGIIVCYLPERKEPPPWKCIRPTQG